MARVTPGLTTRANGRPGLLTSSPHADIGTQDLPTELHPQIYLSIYLFILEARSH